MMSHVAIALVLIAGCLAAYVPSPEAAYAAIATRYAGHTGC